MTSHVFKFAPEANIIEDFFKFLINNIFESRKNLKFYNDIETIIRAILIRNRIEGF